MLSISEDGERFAKFIDSFDDIGAGLGKLFPVNVCVLSDRLEDGVEVLLDGGNVYLAHVEKIFL
jgi:hypothetical protein